MTNAPGARGLLMQLLGAVKAVKPETQVSVKGLPSVPSGGVSMLNLRGPRTRLRFSEIEDALNNDGANEVTGRMPPSVREAFLADFEWFMGQEDINALELLTQKPHPNRRS